jgi:hypothetical protein
MHATYPVAKMSGVPCSPRAFELDQVLLDDPSVFIWQAVNVREHVPIDLEVSASWGDWSPGNCGPRGRILSRGLW